MKSTWPTPAPLVGHPKQPIFHLLALGFCFRGNAHFRVGVGVTQILAFLDTNMLIGNAKWGSNPTRGLNTSGFASQWNIGLRGIELFHKGNCPGVLILVGSCPKSS